MIIHLVFECIEGEEKRQLESTTHPVLPLNCLEFSNFGSQTCTDCKSNNGRSYRAIHLPKSLKERACRGSLVIRVLFAAEVRVHARLFMALGAQFGRCD